MHVPSLDAVIRTCSPDEVRATTHALVLQMARSTDAASFPPEMKAALALAMVEAGLTPDASRAEWDEAIARYVAARPIRADMLTALEARFKQRPAAGRRPRG